QASNGMLAVQDLEPIFHSKEVRQIHGYLVKQHGEKAMSDAEKERDRLLDQLARQALHLTEIYSVAKHVH
ncbi:MAG TPA: GNAT family N-acetyltransferase, partial [Pseudomonas sp.]|nr:GNAT family N-acetyltransferase [Pseudomonas sp.]